MPKLGPEAIFKTVIVVEKQWFFRRSLSEAAERTGGEIDHLYAGEDIQRRTCKSSRKRIFLKRRVETGFVVAGSLDDVIDGVLGDLLQNLCW